MNNLSKRILSSIILIPLIYYVIIKGSYITIFFVTLCFILSCYEWNMMNKRKINKILGFIFLAISFYTFYKLALDYLKVFFIILICISTDVGGYVFGKTLKGPKLTKISPNKTYSGVIGGYVLSLLSLIVLTNYSKNFDITFQTFFLVILISSVSQIGDIIISYFKRLSKIKNTGTIIPGHGGLLDRIDGMIFVFPFFYLFNLSSYLSI